MVPKMGWQHLTRDQDTEMQMEKLHSHHEAERLGTVVVLNYYKEEKAAVVGQKAPKKAMQENYQRHTLPLLLPYMDLPDRKEQQLLEEEVEEEKQDNNPEIQKHNLNPNVGWSGTTYSQESTCLLTAN